MNTARIKRVTILRMRFITQITRLLLVISLLILSACNSPTAQLPDIKLTTIKNTKIETAALNNTVTLVSFWATSCTSCIEEMPELIKTYEKYHDKGFEVLAISMEYDPPAQLVAYTEQKGVPFPVIHDSYGDIAAEFDGVEATPTAYLFNKSGSRVNKTVGILNFEALHAYLDKELS